MNPCGDGHEDLLKKLGKVKTGKACIYAKKLEDIDLNILEAMVARSVRHLRKTYS